VALIHHTLFRTAPLPGWCALPMRNIFAMPRQTPVLSFVAVAILVFSTFALLKISSGGKQEPGQELLTSSIQKSPAVRKPPSIDPAASFVAPSSFQSTLRRVQIGVVVRAPVPLPRPRPKRI
jgi:hypothetical protein